jgi:mono/diheme cytochrome c family protein
MSGMSWQGCIRRYGRRSLLAVLLLAGCQAEEVDGELLAAVPVPEEHQEGAALYRAWCQSCHGPSAAGTDQGPPLVHTVYRPRHHGDEAFQLAVSQGVRAHHFRFGDMQPVPGLSRDEVASITGYIRFLQRAVGID